MLREVMVPDSAAKRQPGFFFMNLRKRFVRAADL